MSAKAILFTNFSNEDFTWNYAGTPYTFKAGGQPVYLEDYKAQHFAKHLVDRELHRMGKQVSDPMRVELEAKCLGGELESDDPSKLGSDVLNKNLHSEIEPVEEVDSEVEEEQPIPFTCNECGFVAKNKVGLIAHQRSHKSKEEAFEGLNK